MAVIKTKKTKDLLDAFATKFPKAAGFIQNSAPAMQLIEEAAMAGAQFGGHPKEDVIAYTVGNMVYVPEDSTDE